MARSLVTPCVSVRYTIGTKEQFSTTESLCVELKMS